MKRIALILLPLLFSPCADADPVGNGSIAEPAKADIVGFRSARFGMDENDVRRAIIKDFAVKADAVRMEVHPVERTRFLTVKARELLPRSGAALVTYILGFSKNTLVQVNVSWSRETDGALTPEMLVGNANILRSHFEAQGFKPESILTNAMTADHQAIVVFRGTDAKNRMVLLMLRGMAKQGTDQQPSLAPTALQLFYIADPEKPDIYKLLPGQF